MRRADIEVPNPAVDLNSWAGSACYPRGSFYPISYGRSTPCRRITKAHFRACAAGVPRSQAPLCLCTRRRVAISAEGTFARLRYLLGGVRPRQPTHQPRSVRNHVSARSSTEWYFIGASPPPARDGSQAPTYATQRGTTHNGKL